MEKITKRDSTFDIIKGIAIILMVLTHSLYYFVQYISLFHMGIFFICSGYFFKDKCYESKENLKNFIKNKVLHIYVPFVLFNLLLTSAHNFLFKINIYTMNPEFLKIGFGARFGLIEPYGTFKLVKSLIYNLLFLETEQLTAQTWFLRTLFWILIVNVIGHFIIKKFIKDDKIFNIVRLCIYIVLLLLGFLCQKAGFNFYSIGTILSCSTLYFCGILYKKYRDKIAINKYTLIFSTVILFLLCREFAGSILHIANKYNSVFSFIGVNIAGFYWVHNISFYINKINILNKILEYTGQHTLSIFLFHSLCFKLVTLGEVIAFNLPGYYLAAVPTCITDHGLWVLYLITGTIVPLFLAFLYSKIKTSKFVTSLSFLKLP